MFGAGVDGAGVLAAGGASGFDVGVAGRTGAGVPLTTELPPRCPMIDKRQREDHEEHRRDRRRLGQERRARARPERRLTAAAAKRAGDITAAALLQKNHQREHQANENVETDEQVVHIVISLQTTYYTA